MGRWTQNTVFRKKTSPLQGQDTILFAHLPRYNNPLD